ncbi:MAG: rhomboid family intramembrane serine protease [Nannocystaceae bacterium]|nr:rhomboid family intramembrane serine protease [Nannocystaceae bacterium]
MRCLRELREAAASRGTWVVATSLALLIPMWVVGLLDAVLNSGRLARFGIQPRDLDGAWGILLAPLLHANLSHLVANTVALLLLGGLVATLGRREWLTVTAVGWLGSGVGVWVLGRPASHIGASGLAFAFLGFLLLRGWYQRSAGSVVLSLGVYWLFGEALRDTLPFTTDPGISWEGHLFGLLSGVGAAALLREQQPRENVPATSLLLSLLALPCLPLLSGGCDGSVELKVKEHELDMWSTPGGDGWLINFVGIKGHATDVVVRFGDSREETYRRPSFQLPKDIKGPIDIWLLEYKLNGKIHRGPFRFRFDPKQAYVRTAKDVLDMLRTEWVTWRRYPEARDSVQTAVLTSHTCGIKRVEYGFGKQPEMDLPMPPCLGPESALGYSDLSFFANEKEHIVLRITFADGEQTPVRKFPNPNYAPDDPTFQVVVAVRQILEDVLSTCTTASDPKACRTAARRPDLAQGDLRLRKGFERVDIRRYCVTDNYARLRAAVRYEDDAEGTIVSSFVRTVEGTWALGKVIDWDEFFWSHDTSDLCAEVPFSVPKHAKKEIFPLTPRWKTSSAGVHLSLPGLSKWRCALEAVEFMSPGDTSPPRIVRPTCWTKAGWSVAEDDIAATLPRSDLDVVVSLRFADGSFAHPVSLKRPIRARLTAPQPTQ